MSKLRRKILRVCLICQKSENIRADGAGKYCRPCRARENHKLKKGIDLTGLKFGRLMVIKLSHIDSGYYWECICDCGKSSITHGTRLRSGKTKSCGCIVATQNHLSRSPTYRSWHAMNQRCYDKSVPHYKRYGAKGIIVCDKWRHSFSEFLKDMGERPTGRSLDRIDPFGNYELSNCRWNTLEGQGSNKINTKYIEAFNLKLSLTQWSKKTGIKWATIRKRICELFWPIEKALTIKPRLCHGKKIKKN